MSDVRKNYDKAEELFRRAIELEPNDANALGNYAKLLITLGRFEEAKINIVKSFELINNNQDYEPLELELWFYCYAIFYDDYPNAEEKIKSLLDKEVTSPNWDLNGVIDVAKERGHPDFEKLKMYAGLISGNDK